MAHRNLKTFLVQFIIIAAACGAARGAELHVVPYPKEVKMLGGALRIDNSFRIIRGNPGRQSDGFAAALLADEFESQFGFRPAASTVPGRFSIVIGLASDPAVARFALAHGVDPEDVIIPESYALVVGADGILLAGADEAGTFYAVQSLRQMLRAYHRDASLPKVRVLDWPSFEFRGVMDDISRGPVPTMDALKLNVRRFAELKINKYNLYIEHVFCYEKHPGIGPEGGCLTAAQLRELDDYAKKFHVELVGGLQSFGHQEHMLALPKYKKLAENVFEPFTLSPANKGTYRLLEDLYDEIVPAVSSPLFNINSDETFELGTGQSRKMAEKMGLAKVYAYHINKLHAMLTPRGKRLMMWADIALKHPDILGLIPRDVIYLPWQYYAEDNYEFALDPIRDTGNDFIVCPAANFSKRMFPDIRVARVNIQNFCRDGARYRALGVLDTTWDGGGENLFGSFWYPLAWGGEAGWNPLRSDADRFDNSFPRVFYGAPDDSFSLAIHEFERAEQLPGLKGLLLKWYWDWPAGTAPYYPLKLSAADARTLLDIARRSERLLLDTRRAASANSGNIAYPLFVSHRLADLARHTIAWYDAVDLYAQARDIQESEPVEAAALLDRIDSLFSESQSGARAVWEEFRTVWLAESRPYTLDDNEAKYNDLVARIQEYRDRIAAAKAQLESGTPLPAPRDIGIYNIASERN